MIEGRKIGLAALSLLDVPPAQFVEYAEAAGFDSVGLRLTGPPGRVPFPVLERPDLLTDLRTALAGSSVDVLDIEVIRLRSDLAVDPLSRVFEVGQELGAKHVLVINDIESESEATRLLEQVAAAAAAFNLSAVLEPMLLSATRSLSTAIRMASSVQNTSVLLDPVHLARLDVPFDTLADIDPSLIQYLQFCDAPAQPPSDIAFESMHHRLLPGQGALHLTQLATSFPPTVPVSLEIPNDALVAQVGPAQYAHLLMSAASTVLGQANTATAAASEPTS